ncbi:MAG TPA: hypothetical protein DDY22_07545 [Geobacter sp.]|nr:hypothetical protein [Geobacter sp.]
MAAELNSLSRHAFQNKFHQILAEIFPTVVNAQEMGIVDRMGIDLYSAGEGADFDLAYQCKGFEITQFLPRHLKDCLKSISDFKNSSRKANCYFLVINKHIPDRVMREELLKALEDLVQSSKTKQATFLDLGGIVTYIFESSREILYSKIDASNRRFLEDYRRRLDQTFYQENVPFIVLPNLERAERKPIEFLLQGTLSYIRSSRLNDEGVITDCSKNRWIFVISEFGFGKTSLLLNLTEKLFANDVIPIYLPIAQFEEEAFTNEYMLCKQILEVVVEEVFDESRYLDKILLKDFQLMMRSTGKYALLFDGLDEHKVAYSVTGLRRIFQCMENFSNKCIFTIRKELWDERRCNFEEAIGPKKKNIDYIVLNDWLDQDIEDYLHQYLRFNNAGGRSSEFISEFIGIVRSGTYHRYYGDIPKRPLFLKMITDDVASGEIKKQNLAQIYQSYLLDKFKLDRSTSVSMCVSERPLNMQGDIIKQVKAIFAILAQAAKMMLINDENCKVSFLSYLLESDLESLIKLCHVPIAETVELLLNSVLVPFDKRTFHDFKVKFAHKSFQEYFTSYFLFMLLCRPGGTRQDYGLFYFDFPDEIVVFMKGMIEDLKTDPATYSTCSSMLASLSKEGHESRDSLIARLCMNE